MTPIDSYLQVKKTAGFASNMQEAIVGGAGTALAAGAVAAAGMAATKIYDAVTKARDFRGMLASPFNHDLHQVYLERPQEFNAAYSSLRSMNPTFAKDPMVAGTYMRRMMTFDASSAGGVLSEALAQRRNEPESPIQEMFMRGGAQGAATGFAEAAKEKSERAKEVRDLFSRLTVETHKGMLVRGGQRNQAALTAYLKDQQVGAREGQAPGLLHRASAQDYINAARQFR